MNRAWKEIESNKRSLGMGVCVIVVIIGLLTHGYAFFDAAFTHDALNALYADPVENEWKISLGRFCKPIYQMLIRGEFAVPWLIGCLSLLWIAIAVYLIVGMFEISSWIGVALISGMMVTNLTVILTAATYIYDLDANMFALMLSALAAYRWNKNLRIDLLAILCISISLGFYQAYVSVCIVLMLMRCIMDVLQGKEFKKIVLKGISACIVLILGAAVYAVLLKLIQYCMQIGMNTGTINGLQNMASLISSKSFFEIARSYMTMYYQLYIAWRSIFPWWSIKVMHLLLGLSLVICTVELIRNMPKESRKNLPLLIPLALFVPPAVLFASILSSGKSLHLLMLYAMWLVYVLALTIVCQASLVKKSGIIQGARIVAAIVVAILIWGNIRTANAIYLIKDMQSEASYSLMTRIVHRMEESEEYVTGVTPVAFIGESSLISPISGAGRYTNLVGVDVNLLKRDPSYSYDPIFKLAANRLGSSLIICDEEEYLQLVNEREVAQMPCYPDEGCMKLINGIFVVKLGN